MISSSDFEIPYISQIATKEQLIRSSMECRTKISSKLKARVLFIIPLDRAERIGHGRPQFQWIRGVPILPTQEITDMHNPSAA